MALILGFLIELLSDTLSYLFKVNFNFGWPSQMRSSQLERRPFGAWNQGEGGGEARHSCSRSVQARSHRRPIYRSEAKRRADSNGAENPCRYPQSSAI